MLKRFAGTFMGLAFSTAILAQSGALSEVMGARFNGTALGADTNASFAIGLTRDDGATFQNSARTSDNISIVGVIRPEPEQIGQSADIFVVNRVNGNFTMRNVAGVYENWTSGRIADLVPYRENQILTDSLNVDVFTGQPGASGEHKLFIGYMADDGILRYTPVPHKIEITAQSDIDQASALFDSNISANVVHGICIVCHVEGGQATGALHVFDRSTTPGHLTSNFNQFLTLLNARGRIFILENVRGLRGHPGGTVLLSGMQEYRDLDTFLQLLEQAN